MNKKIKIIAVTLLIGGGALYAADNGAGSSNDPLVTKSYVDNKIAALQNAGGGNTNTSNDSASQDKLIVALMQEIEKLKAEKSATYEVVTVPAGKTICGKQGTEIIVRSGEGFIVSQEAGGIQDMTEGTDIDGNTLAPKYHLLIIPREDGRGIIANKKLTVMVRGGYTIK